MSGPKVVRIVTREEILTICEGHLRRLAQALANWQERAGRIGELEEGDLASTHARHERLRQLLRSNQFAELQKQVPIEIEFLDRDMVQKEERAAAKAAQKRRSQRQLRENAATLLRTLQSSKGPVKQSLLDALPAIAEGRAVADAEAILAEGFAALGQIDAAGSLTEAQRDLARSLQVERPSRWVAEEHTTREARFDRIDRHIAQLQTLHGAATAEPFLQRLAAIEQDPRVEQRNMLLDSLIVDIAKSTADYQARRDQLATLKSLALELETLLLEQTTDLPAQVAACLADPDPDLQQVAALTEHCVAAVQDELRRRAAFARRQVVLDGLASLGYEVREGMQTAWADAGRVVLRKTATPGYGVEVGGSAESGKLQVRAVSLSGTHDRGRDRDIETIWCGEFTRLRSLLADRGSALTIEKALAIGEVPLKVVAIDFDDDGRVSSERTKGSS